MAKEITLTKGKVAIVDDEDYEALSKVKWFATRGKITWYAARAPAIRMHRVIMNAPAGVQVDHRDLDGLNNQKSNLRIATNSQNQQNAGLQRNNTSGYKGVFKRKENGRWQAQLRHDNKSYYLGGFGSAEEAARAYDAKAKELFGEFARLNFPEGDYNEQ